MLNKYKAVFKLKEKNTVLYVVTNIHTYNRTSEIICKICTQLSFSHFIIVENIMNLSLLLRLRDRRERFLLRLWLRDLRERFLPLLRLRDRRECFLLWRSLDLFLK